MIRRSTSIILASVGTVGAVLYLRRDKGFQSMFFDAADHYVVPLMRKTMSPEFAHSTSILLSSYGLSPTVRKIMLFGAGYESSECSGFGA